MPFRVSLGPEEFQRRQHEALKGLAGVVNKADDILVFGSGDSIEEAEKDHDINLWNFMLRCREVNLKLNPKTFQLKVKQVTCMGHLLYGPSQYWHHPTSRSSPGHQRNDLTARCERGTAVPGHVQLFVTRHPKPCRNCVAAH